MHLRTCPDQSTMNHRVVASDHHPSCCRAALRRQPLTQTRNLRKKGGNFRYISGVSGRVVRSGSLEKLPFSVEGGTPDSQRLTVRALTPHAKQAMGTKPRASLGYKGAQELQCNHFHSSYSGQNIPERCWSGCAQRTFSQGQRRLKKIKFNSCRPVLSTAL